MTEARVQLLVQTYADLENEPGDTEYWTAELSRDTGADVEIVATAQGRSFSFATGPGMFDAYDEVSEEYASMAFAVQESGVLHMAHQNPLLIIDLVVAPQWRGHNIGPYLLRWMATSLRHIGSVFLVPVPLPTRLEAGRWVTDWHLPRAGSGATRKVRRAYRKGGFTHLRSGTWWTAIEHRDVEMTHIHDVMAVLEA